MPASLPNAGRLFPRPLEFCPVNEGLPSATAARTARSRAEHQVWDTPAVFADPIAIPILGLDRASFGTSAQAEARRPGSRALRAFLAARSRFAEDALALSFGRGTRQYVLLGAGLDTFAYRNPAADAGLRVFELDRPATQAWKRRCLTERGIAVPPGVSFVPIDFEHERLDRALRETNFDPRAAAFFSWLGVTMYLTPDVVLRTMRSLRELSAHAEVVFDYRVAPNEGDARSRVSAERLSARVARMGEPFRSAFEPGVLAQDLARRDFDVVEDLDAAAINARYFAGRLDGLAVRGNARLVHAAATAR